MRGALVGFGFIGSKGHFPAYTEMPDVDIGAVCDTTPDRLALLKAAYPHVHVYQNAEELLQKEKIDFLDICTPPSSHYPLALSAAKRGIHVLCEKPLTATFEEADALLRAAEQYQVVIFPCHNYKHAPVVKAMQRVMEQNEIGKVQFMTLTTFRSAHAKGVSEWNNDWRRNTEYSGGGIVMDHGSHNIYLTFMFLGNFPTSVSAKIFHMNPRYATEDNCVCTLKFPNGYATMHLSWTSGCRKIIYTLQGESGACKVEEDELEVLGLDGHVKRKEHIQTDFNDTSHVGWFNSLFGQFKEAVHHKSYVNSELIEAHACMSVIHGIYTSSQLESKEVPIKNIFQR